MGHLAWLLQRRPLGQAIRPQRWHIPTTHRQMLCLWQRETSTSCLREPAMQKPKPLGRPLLCSGSRLRLGMVRRRRRLQKRNRLLRLLWWPSRRRGFGPLITQPGAHCCQRRARRGEIPLLRSLPSSSIRRREMGARGSNCLRLGTCDQSCRGARCWQPLQNMQSQRDSSAPPCVEDLAKLTFFEFTSPSLRRQLIN